MNELADNTATEKSMQEVTTNLEALLYPEAEGEQDEPESTIDDEVSEDEATLPDDDDSDSEDEEGSETDLDDIAEGEDLSLAGYLGLDDDRIVEGEDGQVMFNAIIDGETKQVPLKDLAANFQLQSHVNNKSIALENERKEFEEVRTTAVSELQTRVQGLSKLGEFLENELVGEYNAVDWDRLRVEDPANWTALRQEYAERAQKVQSVQGLVNDEAQRIQQQQQQEFQAKAEEYAKAEMAAMIADNPDWADETVRTQKLGEMKSFLSTYGFSAEDAQGISDHRLIRLIKDAQAYKANTQAAETKRVAKKVPKFQKPNGSTANAAQLAKARKAKALKARIKKTGHVNDIAASILDRM